MKQTKETIKRNELVGEARRAQRRLGFASDRRAELLLKSYVKGTNIDPTAFRCATLAYGPDLSTLSGEAIKATELGYERPPSFSPSQVSCEMDIARFNISGDKLGGRSYPRSVALIASPLRVDKSGP